ncbi:MAG: SprT family zinc-dependent metalloprotease [Actinobacteria bacterium]|nr:SprT family zinc-dependent metalloprotease [Actinomycetota bacterium]
MKLRRAPIESLEVDGLVFAVRWSRRRRTIGISVSREGELRVLAPVGVPARKLESTVRAKLPWVRRKFAEFEALGPPPPPLRFVAGERLPYLGRAYRLVIVDADDRPGAPVALRRGRFELVRDLDGEARAAFVNWYTKRARARIGARVAHYAPLVNAAPSGVVVRDLGKRRWGVCDARTRLVSFHWELVLQPPELVDYVVVHELTHLHEPNHGPRFWQRVAAVMPDWQRRRGTLSRRGHRHAI